MNEKPWDLIERAAVERRDAYALLERPDADAQIRALGALEVYLAVKSLGPDDATPILALMDREQTVALFDLDVWQKDRLAPSDVLVWLTAFREVSVQRMVEALKSLDPEAVAAILKRRLMIARVVRDDDGAFSPDWVKEPPDELLPLIQTPDRRFVIAARTTDAVAELDDDPDEEVEEDERKQVLALIEDLYRELGPEDAGGILRLAETDLGSDLEEQALQFRVARLEDLGFPSRDRAVAIYTPLPVESLGTPGPVLADRTSALPLPALHAERLGRGLFRRALGLIEDPTVAARIEQELVPLANAALVADGVEPGAIELVGEGLERARAYLELGLGAGGADVEQAAERLRTTPLRTLFGVGYGLTVRLATRARNLERSGAFTASSSFDLLEDADQRLLRALLADRPRLDLGDGRRPFRDLADLVRVEEHLDRLEARARIVDALGLRAPLPPPCDPVEPREQSATLRLLTVAASTLVDGRLARLPFDPARLGELTARLAGDRAVAPLLGAVPEPLHAALRAWLDPELDQLARTLSATQAGGTDARFVGLIVRRS